MHNSGIRPRYAKLECHQTGRLGTIITRIRATDIVRRSVSSRRKYSLSCSEYLLMVKNGKTGQKT